jgi:hypothetical protein
MSQNITGTSPKSKNFKNIPRRYASTITRHLVELGHHSHKVPEAIGQAIGNNVQVSKCRMKI